MHAAPEEQRMSAVTLLCCKTTSLPAELPRLSAVPAAQDHTPGEALGWGKKELKPNSGMKKMKLQERGQQDSGPRTDGLQGV